MKIALIGYGKMGKAIERIAKERGHEIVCIIDIDNLNDFESDKFKSADVAIEFTHPGVALSNYRKTFAAGIPLVSGTTGWTNELPALKKEVEEKGYTFFWSSNFSLGVNIFMTVNKYLASLMNRFSDYDVEITEIHHIHKLDAPSGTAITLAEDMLENLERKTCWVKEEAKQPHELAIKSIREDEVPGIHIIRYDASFDAIEFKHEAKTRDGFALGAVMAAEFAVGKKGWLTMQDLLKF
ncbi:MAG TPA: 4-hydroxy-tetrahydrodipicolinate reductase [Paludibacteraceae bacterium]|nr:4-hydroxy-tetrahydrodipicolinate reductase [Paludibacteraceae bacterium]